MTVAIIDYGSGNLRSAAKAFERAAAESGCAEAIEVTAAAERIAAADRVVLPGVGAFADCMAGLAALDGALAALDQAVLWGGRPFLGICVGMQLMASLGREHGSHDGLGWIAGEVVPIEPDGPALKIPHMGWNDLHFERPGHPVFAGIGEGAHGYFVHGYHFACARPEDVIASVEYGRPLAAAIGRDNLVGTQFHPEKSQAAGLRLIANFLAWRP
jgi:glutamine amidotransferase